MAVKSDDGGPLELGTTFDKYEIRSLIGRGGYGWVYHGHYPYLARDVAIKILHRPGGVTDDMLRRGQREAQLLDAIKHPNIVEIIDAGLQNELSYIIMELLRGRHMRSALHEHSRFSLVEALLLFAEVADAMAAAHGLEKPAIHRDLKPENVFILHRLERRQIMVPEVRDEAGNLLKPAKVVDVEANAIKVLDFGIAKIGDTPGLTTRKNGVLGTALYMSPEHAQGFKVTALTDVYALGTMMFEALLGIHPCRRDWQNPELNHIYNTPTVVWRQITQLPPMLHELDPSIPPYVSRMVDRAIAKRPELRIGSMREFAQAMRDCLRRYLRELDDMGSAPSVRDLSRQLTDGVPPSSAQLGPNGTELLPPKESATAVVNVGGVAPPKIETAASNPRFVALPDRPYGSNRAELQPTDNKADLSPTENKAGRAISELERTRLAALAADPNTRLAPQLTAAKPSARGEHSVPDGRRFAGAAMIAGESKGAAEPRPVSRTSGETPPPLSRSVLSIRDLKSRPALVRALRVTAVAGASLGLFVGAVVVYVSRAPSEGDSTTGTAPQVGVEPVAQPKAAQLAAQAPKPEPSSAAAGTREIEANEPKLESPPPLASVVRTPGPVVSTSPAPRPRPAQARKASAPPKSEVERLKERLRRFEADMSKEKSATQGDF